MKNIKRIGAFVLALVMVLSMMSINVFAEDYTETEPYFYLYGDTSITEFKNKSSWYWSPHRGVKTYADGTTKNTGIPMMFPLLNMSTFETIKTYCLDADVSVADIAEYRRLNIEDSTYFSKEEAAKVRAIFMNGFSDASQTADIQTAANTWLASKGMEQIVDLTGAQALAATQYAIWMLSNPAISDISYYDTYSAKDNWLFSMYDIVGVNPKETAVIDGEGNNITEKNINLLRDYLLNLDGVAASTVLVSDAMLAGATVSDAVLAGDGTYSVTVTANIDGVKAEDDIFFTAMSGTKNATVAVTASGAQTVTLTGLTEAEANGMITVEINGTQKGNDVYLYDAKGPRGTSQTMVGFDTGVMNVHAEAIVGNDERVLKIYKTTPADAEGNSKPLPNIGFTLYKVASIEDIENGTVVLGEAPTADDVAEYATNAYEIVTITTDANGYAEYNFSRNGMADGVYMVVENPTSSVQAAINPFFIIVPMTNETGDGYVYEIVAQPKNEIIADEPTIDKDVTSLGQNSDTKDVGETVNWIINSYIPSDIKDGISYVITDDVDTRLGTPSNVVVNVADADAVDVLVALVADTDYVAKVENNTLTVTLTKAGMKKIADAVGANVADYVIRVTFDTVLTTSATLGENIPNDATVTYENSVGFDFTKESEEVEVHTGGLQIDKVNDDSEALAGAKFKIVRKATDAEIADENIEKIVIGGVSYVYVDFYATSDMSGEKVYEVTTDADGKALIYGLAYGDYKIIETVAPKGYNLLRDPIDVTIGATSHLDENSVKVVNINKFTLPSTGGIGTTIFTVTGLILIGAAVVLVIINKKKKVKA